MAQPISTTPQAIEILAINEKVTRHAAKELLARSLSQSPAHGLEILDNATGGGALVHELLELAASRPATLSCKQLLAGDINESTLAYARTQLLSTPPVFPIDVRRLDQQATELPENSLDYVFSNFGIFFSADDTRSLADTLRVLKPRGTAGFATWKDVAWWPSLAAPALRKFVPEAPEVPAPGSASPPSGWTDVESVRGKLEAAGFCDVEVAEFRFGIDIEAEEFARATGVLVGVMAKRAWDPEVFAAAGPKIEGALLRYLKEEFSDGRWDGEMTAIISLGRKA
nr:methyltransferase tpch [Quercus suber]